MVFFTFIMLGIIITILIMKKYNAQNNEIMKILDILHFIMGMTLTIFFNFMMNLNFIYGTGKITLVIILMILKAGVLIISHIRKNSKLFWGVLILILCDLFLISVYLVYGIDSILK